MEGSQATLEFIKHGLQVASIITAGGISVNIIGSQFGKRIGPWRAVVVGLRSRLLGKPQHLSIRHDIVSDIVNKWSAIAPGSGRFALVTGPKGVGKSTALHTAAMSWYGVIHVDAGNQSVSQSIVTEALCALTNVENKNVMPHASARRVIFFHNLFFGMCPTIVINLNERKLGDSYCEVTEAARTLSSAFKLRVIVDGSGNSVPPAVDSSLRCDNVSVGPMDRTSAEHLPQHSHLHSFLKELQLSDLAWSVLGGVVCNYDTLSNTLLGLNSSSASDLQTGRAHVEAYLRNQLIKSNIMVTRDLLHYPASRELFHLISRDGDFPENDAVENYPRPSPDKILRTITASSGQPLLIPATPTIALVLKLRFYAAGLSTTPVTSFCETALRITEKAVTGRTHGPQG